MLQTDSFDDGAVIIFLNYSLIVDALYFQRRLRAVWALMTEYFGLFSQFRNCRDQPTYKTKQGSDLDKRQNFVIQSNFNGSNTFGAMKISSRQG